MRCIVTLVILNVCRIKIYIDHCLCICVCSELHKHHLVLRTCVFVGTRIEGVAEVTIEAGTGDRTGANETQTTAVTTRETPDRTESSTLEGEMNRTRTGDTNLISSHRISHRK